MPGSRIEGQNGGLVSSDEQKWRHVGRQSFQPGHVHGCADGSLARHRQSPVDQSIQGEALFRIQAQTFTLSVGLTSQSSWNRTSVPRPVRAIGAAGWSLPEVPDARFLNDRAPLIRLGLATANRHQTTCLLIHLDVETGAASHRTRPASTPLAGWRDL